MDQVVIPKEVEEMVLTMDGQKYYRKDTNYDFDVDEPNIRPSFTQMDNNERKCIISVLDTGLAYLEELPNKKMICKMLLGIYYV